MANEAVRVLRNTFYASVGFGVLAFQKAQVRRREVERAVRPPVESIVEHLPRRLRPADPLNPMRLAVDATALLGARTGVGRGHRASCSTRLATEPDLDVIAFGVTWRGRHELAGMLPDGIRDVRRPMAARPLREAWSRADQPPIEWWTGPVDVVHGPNYVVPPSRGARRARVGPRPDLRPPPRAVHRRHPRLSRLIRRALRRGATVHTGSAFVADEIADEFGVDADRRRGGPLRHADRCRPTNPAPTPTPAGRSPAPGTTCSPSAPSSPARTSPRWCAPSTAWPPPDPDLRPRARRAPTAGAPTRSPTPSRPARTATASAGSGWVDERQRAALLRGAAVYAYPSIYEGFGLPPLEAMAAGTPVVTSTAGSLPEVVGDAALTIAPGDADALADAIGRLLDDDGPGRGPAGARPAPGGHVHLGRHCGGPRRHLPSPGRPTLVDLMRALVTGAAGFVGRHLVGHLESMGDDVVGVDRHDGPDLLDAAALDAFVADVAPDAVYHLAGWSDVGGSWSEPRAAFAVNAEGTLNLLQACRSAPPACCRSAAPTSTAACRWPSCPSTEDAPLRPVTPYAVSKVAADFLGLQATLGYGLDVMRVRAFNHLGPGQTNRFVAPAIAERIARNEFDGSEVVPVGNLTPRRDFTDVRDVVRAYRLLDRPRRGRRGLQRVLRRRHRHQRPGRPARGDGRPARCASRRTRRSNARSTCRCCAATPPSCTRPPAGSRRSRSDQTLSDLLDEWRTRIGP